MKNPTKLSAKEKAECVIRLENGEHILDLAKEYKVAERSIWRWKHKYDGTIKSLENKSSVPLTPHPKKMPPAEEQKLIEIINTNPNISNKCLSIALGTGRDAAFLSKKREKLLGKRKIHHKYDYATIFNKQVVDEINKSDALKEEMPSVFFTISVLPDLYIQICKNKNPVCITPFISVAIKFKTREEANKFMKTLASNHTRWKPEIVEIRDGIPV